MDTHSNKMNVMRKWIFTFILTILFFGIMAQENKPSEVLDTIKTVSAADNQTAEKIYNQGIVLFQQGKYDEAIAQFNEAIKIKPNFAKAYINRATSKVEQKKYAESISDYNMAIMLEPSAKSFFSRGLVRYQM